MNRKLDTFFAILISLMVGCAVTGYFIHITNYNERVADILGWIAIIGIPISMACAITVDYLGDKN
ncbi:hypothetical protein A6E01_20280 (plasmid) [Vibrio breoganii]|uniref:Uncharacterized protein n=1 Tax=Vibrio breoganii TaxID=553239 RepID=A0AAN0XZW4_9VIBR|nr:hypothetical protein [Vibrio breoganii]ANO35552.1 hypothetical protein A6E01_20280 [Vibrio breoganii]PML15815.1 hypothetical protein BCT84_07375 [Vibrio breoganii]